MSFDPVSVADESPSLLLLESVLASAASAPPSPAEPTSKAGKHAASTVVANSAQSLRIRRVGPNEVT